MRAGALLCCALAACGAEQAPELSTSATGASAAAWFVDATAGAGIDFVHDAGFTAQKHLAETMGGGAACVDLDEDGALDLYFVQSGPIPVGPAAERTDAMPPNRLFLGDGSGSFRDATAASGHAAHRGYGMGAIAGDADGDGHLDLFVTNLGPDALLLGDGRAAFRDATEAAGVGDGRWTTGACFFDAELDGDLDLYVTAYVDMDLDDPPWCGRRDEGWRSFCHPDHYAGLEDRYWRNEGDGRFVDATAEVGLAGSDGKGLGVVAADFDLDGDLDLYVANDSTENRVWRNAGDGTFLDDTPISGGGVNGIGATEAGMGIAVGDIDGDLDLDLFVTNFDDESNTLYRTDEREFFTDVTAQAGLDAPSRLPVGFGTVFEDFDLDGDLDLAVANGHIIDNIHLYHDGKTWAQPAQLYVNAGDGRFTHAPELAGALGATPFVGRGLYTGDFDRDGRADLLLTQCNGPARLFRNTAPARPALHLRGVPPGVVLELETSTGAKHLRTDAGPSYCGASSGELALALADGERVRSLRILSPGAATLEFAPGLPDSFGPGTLTLTGTHLRLRATTFTEEP